MPFKERKMGMMNRVSQRIDMMQGPKDEKIREASKYLRANGYDVPAMRTQGSKFLVAYAEELKRIKLAA